MKTEAAFYIPKEQVTEEIVDPQAVERTKGELYDAFKNHKKMLNFDINKMCRNLTLQGKTELVQRYAVGAISKIINNEPITNKSMLDALFNTYAPAFNATLEKSGYNSVMAMKDAAFEGTINPASFLSAFNSGLTAFQRETDFTNQFARYGEEIPIDVIEKCDYLYEADTAERRTAADTKIDYVNYLKPIKIILTAHIKNENAKDWKLNDYSEKLASVMAVRKPIAFRVGNNIYEDVIIEKYNPTITNAYDIKFTANITYSYEAAKKSIANRQSNKLILNAIDNEVKNRTAKTVYLGEGKVEKVTKKDSILISQMKKVLNKDKIMIDGEEI